MAVPFPRVQAAWLAGTRILYCFANHLDTQRTYNRFNTMIDWRFLHENLRVLEKCMGKAVINRQRYGIGARLSWIALEIALVDARSLSDYFKRPRRKPLTILQLLF